MKEFFSLLIFFMSFSINSLELCSDNPEEEWNNCLGTHQYPDGETYSGEWQNNSYHKGVIIYENGDKYIGDFQNNLIFA